MRAALLTNLTARASLPVLQGLAASRAIELEHVFFYDTLADSRASPLRVLRQFGMKTSVNKIGQLVMSKLRTTMGARIGAHWVRPKSAYEFAEIHRQSHSTITDINLPESIELLQHMQLDVLVVCVCKNILRARVLALSRPKFVNIHPSLLPDYRGPTPTFWMLYHGERQTGFTIHRMTTHIDQGTVLRQGALALDRRQTELKIEIEVFTAAAEVLEETLLALNVDEPAPETIAEGSAGSYYTYPTPAERQELKRRMCRGDQT